MLSVRECSKNTEAAPAVATRPEHLPDQETIDGYLRRSAELRAAAANTGNRFRRESIVALAESYEKLAPYEPPQLTQRA